MKYILKSAIVLSLTLAVVACGGVTGGNKENKIAKSWVLDMKAMSGDSKSGNEEADKLAEALSSVFEQAIRFNFKSNGTFTTNSPLFDSSGESETGKWRISGNDLIMETDGYDKKVTLTIVKLTSKKLVFEMEGNKIHLKPE